MLQQKKAEKQELVGDKKYVKKSELEEARLKRIREEEEAERRAKVSSWVFCWWCCCTAREGQLRGWCHLP